MCNFSKRLLAERKRLNKNQAEMAAIGGVAKRTYCNYEAGDREPMSGFLAAIAAAGADVQYILTGVPGYKPETLKLTNLGGLDEKQEKSVTDFIKLTDEVITNDNLSYLDEKQAKSKYMLTELTDGVITNDNLSYLDEAQIVEYLPVDKSGNDEKHAAEGLVGYEPLRPDQLALLDNLAHCPKEVQDAIKRLALVSARADRDKTQSGTD